MAFMNQEKKARLAPQIKVVLKKYGAKGSISVKHHSTLVVTIAESPFGVESGAVNHYGIDRKYSGTLAAFLTELRDAMMDGNHDRSDIMTDYFDVGWYIAIQFGTWDKPHRVLQAASRFVGSVAS